ncbi:hypothetical protein CEE36_02840 [candidate division TA06 bacterium B3_TA06]|uniref:PIN domain-containing protein n=1 Tax=candidate division TA06 bacterium B3_TA06 TaxID=2012487 RepID=A0A532V8Z5_UNCT6|nr:MAG: hypothetical protein CEE36_02840 [candidate division TA06 bacterium B3_TA06]
MKLFLDTTVQMNRYLGKQKTKKKIRKKINQSTSCTASNYVLGEYRWTIVKDAAIFLNLLKSSNSINEAVNRLPSYNRRTERVTKKILGPVMEELRNSAPNRPMSELKEALQERVEYLLDWLLDYYFWVRIDRDSFVKSPECVDARIEPSASEKISCPLTKPPPCDIEDFWSRHKAELKSLAHNLPDSLSKFKSPAASILRNPEKAHGKKCRYILGDAIIATQCPKGYRVFTTNTGDFQPICQAVGKSTPIGLK